MLGLLGDVKPYTKNLVGSSGKIRIDTYVNKLHYRFTTGFLILCCILVTANDYIGKPIECIIKAAHGNAGQFGKAVNTYCWISSTYTLPAQQDKQPGQEVAHPGVGPGSGEPDEEKVYHAYYQWVPFVLFFQAVLFYLPHYIWRNLENKTLEKLLQGLVAKSLEASNAKKKGDDAYFDDPEDEDEEGGEDDESGRGGVSGGMPLRRFVPKSERDKKMFAVAEYMCRSVHQHSTLYAWFVGSELLSFLVVVGNIAFTDAFLGGEFSTYGTEVLNFINQDDEFRTDPMIRVFPRITKCDWHHYGASGTIQKVDALCVLALNIINEKIYVFLWFWFVILSVITGIKLVIRGVEACVPEYRKLQLRRVMRSRREERYIDGIVSAVGLSDWFLLREVKKHMNPTVYPKFLRMLAEELGVAGSAGYDARDSSSAGAGNNKGGSRGAGGAAGPGSSIASEGAGDGAPPSWKGLLQRKFKKGLSYV